ncbi:MAG: pyruvate kinase [Candidatus Bathyarchaeum sp.]|nr:MAG: pyruvate kinase [Candidatus Bathyarchaeum sp.]
MTKKTKIVCTIGPSSLQPETLEKMVHAGMNCVRINTAYGDFDRYKLIVDSVREIADIPVMVDLKGPEIRIKTDHELTVNSGDVLDVGSGAVRFNHNFVDQMSIGDIILVDNGRIRASVTEKSGETLRLHVERGGVIADGKGVNVPNKKLKVQTLSQRDHKIIDFATERQVEFLALSFTRNAKDVTNLRSAAQSFKGAVVSKIENFEGITNFNQILNASEAIMVARGDLGIEIATERVPLVQKSLIRKCNQAGKTVITATEMLESMMHQPSPTRAEVSDVANAILDGTDATMLSGETAIGNYPVESVAMMARVANETEKAAVSSVEDQGFVNISDTVSRSIHRICTNMPLDKIVTLTRSGYTAKMITRFKVSQPIIAVTSSKIAKRQLELVYGVIPVLVDYRQETDRILAVACNLFSKKLLDIEDTVLFTAAFRTKQKHASNLIEIHKIKELLDLKENGTVEPAS